MNILLTCGVFRTPRTLFAFFSCLVVCCLSGCNPGDKRLHTLESEDEVKSLGEVTLVYEMLDSNVGCECRIDKEVAHTRAIERHKKRTGKNGWVIVSDV